MRNRLKTIWYMLTAVMLAVAVGCGGPSAEEIEQAGTSTNVSVEDFKYSQSPGEGRVLSGKLRNDTGAHIRNAQVLVSLYDGDNQRISTMRIDIKDVPPGEGKAFREPVDSDLDVRGAKVRSVLLL